MNSKINLFAGAAATACLLMLPLSANATDLSVSNNSKNDIELCVKGACSSKLMIEAHTIRVIPEEIFNKVCGFDENNQSCVVDVFIDNSTFRKIATLKFNAQFGVESLQGDSEYSIGGNGFNVFLYGPWVKGISN
jgi:hypothetical protein